MKRKSSILFLPLLGAAIACGSGGESAGIPEEPVKIIFETDLGNDIDDALALDMLYKYMDAGKAELLAICLNKEGRAPAEYADIMNTWYGYPDVPIGIIHDGIDCENDAVNYAKAVAEMKDESGNPKYARSLEDHDALPESHLLAREILSKQKDGSVTMVSVGFSTNLIRLLDTQPDEYSELDGEDLVARKVNLLVIMAGCFNDPGIHEYNVVKDIPAAKRIMRSWPTEVVVTPFELGVRVCYPASSIENDFDMEQDHPMVDAYEAYMPMLYDRPMWDPSAVLYAVESDKWFSVSPAGTIDVSDDGSTTFAEASAGNRRYLYVDDIQADAMKNHFVELVSTKPLNKK